MRDGKTVFQKAILPCFGALTWQVFLVMKLNGRLVQTIDFGTLFDLRVEIFYCCCNGTLGKSYPE